MGAGCTEVGDVLVYSGTSGWVATTVDRLHLDLSNIIEALVGADPNTYNYIAEVETSGKCIEWVKDRIDQLEIDYDQMIDYIKDTPAGSNGVIFSRGCMETAVRSTTPTQEAYFSIWTSPPREAT
ncbi:MAG: hypothetical protein ACLTK0_09050 [Anaerovoracaceae bacterium]